MDERLRIAVISNVQIIRTHPASAAEGGHQRLFEQEGDNQ
jgi:hypothetical protein